MSQRNVEQVIGRLLTDERFRRRFTENRERVIEEVVAGGLALNDCERRALLSIDAESTTRFAEHLHPCIQKVELDARRLRRRANREWRIEN